MSWFEVPLEETPYVRALFKFTYTSSCSAAEVPVPAMRPISAEQGPHSDDPADDMWLEVLLDET
jgi:hypothetical protein